ncbi:P-type conjugative transfer protein TrbL [Sphingobium ummariense]|uniref:Conjugal transfer protein TrbL n=1 Tax=Sphingobium ummariense RL-3 TaxID=1346791 RepID=T0J6F4_9SPHN|nr:P-type conjugative transfer protein TrbL [Sphingobium ummariense]EQB33556.1 hypothetical protein M529_03530 [Sphingobium ummariense RL-3]
MAEKAGPAILSKFLDAFSSAIDGGFGLINGDVVGIMAILATIAIGLAAIFWALDENGRVTSDLFRKTLLFGFFIWIVNDWKGLSWTVVKGFAALGLKAGGGHVSVDTFLNNPSKIVELGFAHVQAMSDCIGEWTGPVAFFDNFAAIAILAFAAAGTIVAFFIVAVQLVVTLIEFRLVTLAAFVLVPFGVLKQSSFLAERAFGYVVSVGLKLMVIALVVTISSKTFENIALVNAADPDAACIQALSILLAAILVMMLSLTIPSIAAALVTGGPQLGAGAALAGTAGVAAAAGGAYLAGRGAMSAVGKAAGAPAAIAAKAQAAAGAIREGAQTGIPPLGGAGRGTMGPAPGPSPSGGGGGAPSGGGSGGGTMPAGGGGSGSGAPLDTAPTDRMRDTAQKVASEKGIEPPDMADGRAVRAFLNENSGADLGAYRPNASPPPTGVDQPSGTTGSASTTSSAAAAAADSVPTLAANEGSAAAEASAPAPQSPPAPSTAPPPEITTARAAARSKAQRASRTTRAAQTAAAATSSQRGAGMTANIEHSEE